MSHKNKDLYEFGGFRLDVSERRLLAPDGEKIPLPEKVFATLCILAKKSGSLVRKDELLAEVWAGAYVEENNLDKAVSVLRRALGEKRDGQIFIETVRKHGYRFVAEVVRVEVQSPESRVQSPVTENQKSEIRNPKSNDAHHYAVERRGNVLAVADWQAERKIEAIENPPAPIDEKSVLHAIVAPVVPAADRFGWSPKYAAVLLAALILLGVVLAFSVSRVFDSKAQSSLKFFEQVKFRKVVGSDGGRSPTISPDGKTAAYQDSNLNIWLENLATGSRIQLKNGDEPIRGGGPQFAPDGNYLFYTLKPEDEPQLAIFRVALPNGTPRKVVGNVWTDAAVSPDGKQIAFARRDANANDHAIFVVDTDGTNERKIASRFGFNWFALWGGYLAWSPDGEKIAVVGGAPDDYKPGDPASLMVIDVADGAEFVVPAPDWQIREFGELKWTADGNALLVSAKDSANASHQIWQVSYPHGAWRRITNDLNEYRRVDISADGETLITTQIKNNCNLWQMPFADATHARQLTDGQSYLDGNLGLALTPDARKIIYASNETGNYEIWSANADGSNRRRITFGGESATEPSVTPDNRYIVFLKVMKGVRHVWRMDADGNNLTQLTTTGDVEVHQPIVTPDSRFVIYTAYNSVPKGALYRISIDGGEPIELTDKFGGGLGAISPNGKWLAYSFYDYETREQPWRLAVIPAAGGAAVKNIEMPLRGLVRWTTDSQSLLHLDDKWMNLRQTPVFGSGAPVQLTDFKTGYLRRFALSPDGKQLVLARGNTETNIVLIESENAP